MAFDKNTGRRNRSWWQQRTQMERNGIIILVIAFLLLLALIIALGIVAHKKGQTGTQEEVCNSETCVQTSAFLLKRMDQSVDPCDSFYDFACGKFLRENDIPDDQSSVGLIADMTTLSQTQLKRILEEPSSPDEIRPFMLFKQYYQKCLNVTQYDDDSELKEYLGYLGGWPILDGNNWNERNFNWKNSVYAFRKYGLTTDNFIKIIIDNDDSNSSQYILQLDQVDADVVYLSQGIDSPLAAIHRNYLVDLAVFLGANKAVAEYEVQGVLELKLALFNIMEPAENRVEQTDLIHLMTVSELQRRYPTINWIDFLNKVINLPNGSITGHHTVNVRSPKYLSQIGYVLDRASKRAQANHAIFQFLSEASLYLPSNARQRVGDMEKIVTGAKTELPRWHKCVTDTTKHFGIGTGALYSRKYFNDEVKKTATEIVSDIREAFIDILKKSDWMDKSTKDKAIEKAVAINTSVAYPEEFLDDKKLNDYYSELQVDPNSKMLHFRSAAAIFNKNKEMRRLFDPVDRSDWTAGISMTDINAAYNFNLNSIHLPPVILQDAIFDKNYLRAVNYGNMGFFVGHEITHGFDDQGKKRNKYGNLEDWWDPKTNEAFLQKAKCIIEQYSNYTEPLLNEQVNGVLTQGENIADNGGMKEAYLAYNKWIEKNGPEPKLPGLKYTPKQIFWISAASVWCFKENEAAARSTLADVHAPLRFRVTGTFTNSDDFAKDFNCPVGSKMNPTHKCPVW